MANLNFALLGGPVDAIGEAMKGFETGREQAQKRSLQNALSALSRNPSDPEAMRVVQALSPRMAIAMEDAAYQRQERQRDGEFRNALTDMLLGRGGETAPNALMPSGAPPVSPGVAAQPSAFQRAATADPEKAMSAQADLAKMSNEQLKTFMDLNSAAFQMLGGVHDQASYEQGLARIEQMFGRFGLDLGGLNLPAEYSPEVVDGLRRVAMSTKDQLATERADRRLDWDIEDDRIDNSRADRNTDSLVQTRQERVSISRERGRDRQDDPSSPNDVIGDVVAKFTRGERLTPREQQLFEFYQRNAARGGGRRRTGGATGGTRYPEGTIISNGSQKMIRRNGQWVPYSG